MDNHYTEPEQLLADESFLSWYFRGEGEEDWNSRIKDQPGLAKLVEEASDLLDTIRVREAQVSGQRLQAAEVALFKKIGEMQTGGKIVEIEGTKIGEIEGTKIAGMEAGDAKTVVTESELVANAGGKTAAPGGSKKIAVRRWMVAATALAVLAGVVIITVRIAGERQVKTAYGEIAQRKLPDGTEVTVDANSRLSYPTAWEDGADREVWIRGEAFFHVAKTPQKSRFIVHTDHFDIIVTGTRFNVVNRHGDENVLLQEGSVVLRQADGKEMAMRPGDFVRFHASGDAETLDLERSNVKTDSVIAWKDQKLVFNRTPLRELVTIVNDHYGVNLQLQDPSLGDSTITAILPNNNLDVLLQSLEATSEFDIIRKDDQITIAAHQGHN